MLAGGERLWLTDLNCGRGYGRDGNCVPFIAITKKKNSDAVAIRVTFGFGDLQSQNIAIPITIANLYLKLWLLRAVLLLLIASYGLIGDQEGNRGKGCRWEKGGIGWHGKEVCGN